MLRRVDSSGIQTFPHSHILTFSHSHSLTFHVFTFPHIRTLTHTHSNSIIFTFSTCRVLGFYDLLCGGCSVWFVMNCCVALLWMMKWLRIVASWREFPRGGCSVFNCCVALLRIDEVHVVATVVWRHITLRNARQWMFNWEGHVFWMSVLFSCFPSWVVHRWSCDCGVHVLFSFWL